jgi:hypothetical protein
LAREEFVERDLKDKYIAKELVMYIAAWKLAIHVPKP